MPRFSTDVGLRWGDLDALGHVNNGAFVDVLQEARVALLLRGPDGTGPVAELLGGGIVVAAHQLEYLRPVTATREPVRVEVWSEQVGAARVRLGYHVWAGEALVCRARTELCPFDLGQESVRRLSPAERDFFAAVADEGEPLRTLDREADPAAEPVDFDLVVRWGDLDSYGHVNNVRFYDYFQEARVRFVEDAGLDLGSAWVVARQDVRYLRQVHHRVDPYRIRTRLGRVGTTSIRLDAELTDPATGTVHATCTTICVAVDATGRPQRVRGAE